MRIDKQRGAACGAELMHALLLPEQVPLHVVFAAVKYYIRALGIDVEIAVFAADGTVAVGHLLCVQRGDLDFVLDGSTVAVGFVPYLRFGVRI